MDSAAHGSTGRTYVVGICGGLAAGKSALAQALAPLLSQGAPPLRVEALCADRWLRAGEAEEPLDPYAPEALDCQRLCGELDRLTGGGGAPDVLLLEGRLILHEPTIRERLALRLFVDLEADLRALRHLVIELGPESPVDLERSRRIQDAYGAAAHAAHSNYVEPSRVFADLTLRGDADLERLAPMVAAVIRDRAASTRGRAASARGLAKES